MHRPENAIIDIPAVAIPDEMATPTKAVAPLTESPQTTSPQFSVGDHVPIIRRQHGQDPLESPKPQDCPLR
ncbi:MAG: hypothetical protein WCD18_24835 [Thermosynechococcaceae cyanobacterium]